VATTCEPERARVTRAAAVDVGFVAVGHLVGACGENRSGVASKVVETTITTASEAEEHKESEGIFHF